VEEVERIVVMGGPMSVHDDAEFSWLAAEKAFLREAAARGTAILGVCLGAQLLAEVLGGEVTRNPEREIGWFPIERLPGAEAHPLGACFPATCSVFHWHGETFSLPPEATALLRSTGCAQQGFAWGERVLGLQFHLETTVESAAALVANARADLAPGRFVQQEGALLADSAAHAASVHRILDRVLTRLFG